MAQWTPLVPLPESPFRLPKATEAQRLAINEQIEQILKHRRWREEHAQQIRAADPATLDAESLVSGCELMTRVALEKDEYGLRLDLHDFLNGPYREALTAAVDAAWEAVQQTEADVRKRLVSIGYVDLPVHHGVRGTIVPDFVNRHPEMLEARDRYQSLKGHASSNDWVRDNITAMRRLAESFERHKQRALAEAEA